MGVVLLLVLPVGARAQQPPRPCQYIRDFKRLHDLAPDSIGACTSRRVFAANGDVLQYTANGLIVRRKADNWTAFTDGHITLIDGPRGLLSRANDDRFAWEHDAATSRPEDLPAPASRLGPEFAYPNSALTPGATDPRVTQRSIKRTVCSADYVTKAQPAATYVDRLKVRQIARYKYADTDLGSYEEDHFIPIELGGDPDAPSNMWPQPLSPTPGAREKDRVEAFLHEQVCSGRTTLAAAQQAILNDWIAVYQQLPAADAA